MMIARVLVVGASLLCGYANAAALRISGEFRDMDLQKRGVYTPAHASHQQFFQMNENIEVWNDAQNLDFEHEEKDGKSLSCVLGAPWNPSEESTAERNRNIKNAKALALCLGINWLTISNICNTNNGTNDDKQGLMALDSVALRRIFSFLHPKLMYRTKKMEQPRKTTEKQHTKCHYFFTVDQKVIDKIMLFVAPNSVAGCMLQYVKRLRREMRGGRMTRQEYNSLTEKFFTARARFRGPPNTPYEGGEFYLNIAFPPDYPFKPFKIRLDTPIYHLNVNSMYVGYIEACPLGRKLRDEWSPATFGFVFVFETFSTPTILRMVYDILETPDDEHYANPELARLWKTNREEYEKNARAHTLKHALPKK